MKLSGKTVLMVSDKPVKQYRDYQLHTIYAPGNVQPLEIIYLLPAEEMRKAIAAGLKLYEEKNNVE